jgi:hypothetical protein
MAHREPFARALVKISEHRYALSVPVLAEIMSEPENASTLRVVRAGA